MDCIRSLLQKHPEVTVTSIILDCIAPRCGPCRARSARRYRPDSNESRDVRQGLQDKVVYIMAAMIERYLLLPTPITSLLREFNMIDLVFIKQKAGNPKNLCLP